MDEEVKSECMTDEILDMIQRRQKTLPRYRTEYRKLHNEIRTKCRQTKEVAKQKMCRNREIE